MNYLVCSACLFVFLLVYIWLAEKYVWKDIPNYRSSHHIPTVTGGGIVLPVSLISWSILQTSFQMNFLIPLILLSLLGLLDDQFDLPFTIRLFVQSISCIYLIYHTSLDNYSIYTLIFSLLFLVGWINAFNFMDGINGIIGINGLVTLSSLWFINEYQCQFVRPQIIEVSFIALVVFGFFNFRKKAKCFAGDIGSLSLAFLLGYLMIILVQKSGNPLFGLMFSLFGMDVGLTLFERLIRKENILKAHRSHLYQLYANENGRSHISVSFVYGIIQLFINISLIWSVSLNIRERWIYAISVVLILCLIYVFIKLKVFKVQLRPLLK